MTDEPDDADATEDRALFGERREESTALVACELGVARVDIAGGRVGQFTLAHRCTATAVAAAEGHADAAAGDHSTVTAEGRAVAGTTEGVLVADGDGFASLGEFETVAVGLDDERVLAATPDGRVRETRIEDGEWETVGTVSEPRRFDGAVLAAADGVYRAGETVESLGLTDVSDVARTARTDGDLFAATADGLFRRTDGEWVNEFDSAASVVAAAGGRAHAVDEQGVLERVDGDWQRRDAPGEPVDIAYGSRPYGITADGTILVAETEHGGWRSHPLGLRGVVGFALR